MNGLPVLFSYSKKMKTHKPKTTIEAINDLQQLLEADLYSKFKPIEMIKGEKWCREDYFKNENDFHKYIEEHFELLRKQICTIKSGTNHKS